MEADVGGGGGGGGEGGMADMGADVGGADAAVVCECGADCDDPDCREPAECAGDEACQGDRICESGACTDGCADDAACVATPERPICIEGRCGNCREDADCFGAATCGDDRTCAAPDTCGSTRECLGDGVCVDASEACEPAFRCDAEGAHCPGNFECEVSSGECRPLVDNDCDNSAQCAFGQVCLTFPQRCGACTNNIECAGEQTCQPGPNGGRCVEPNVCNGDVDCLGGRVCDGGLCAAPVCQQDAFVGNDSVATAAVIAGDRTYRDLYSCGDDWYAVEIPANTRAAFILRQHDRSVDLDLARADESGRILELMASGMATERLVVEPRADARTVYLVVMQDGPASVGAYELQIDFTSPLDCVDDAYELGGGDDTFETARIIRSAGEVGFSEVVSGRICEGDVDYVCFHQGISELLSVTATVTGGAVLEASLQRFGRDQVRESGRWSSSGVDTQDIDGVDASDGVYCLRLASESGSGTYTLQLSAYTAAVDIACSSAVPLELEGGVGSAQGDLNRSGGIVTPLCADGANASEAIYRVSVEGPRLLTARVVGLGTGSMGDPVVSVRRDCRVASTEMACAASTVSADDPFVPRTNPVVLRTALPEAGNYYVYVDGIDVGRNGDYRLEVQTSGLVAPPVNDRCEDAEPLELFEGLNQFEANLDQAGDDHQACFGSGGADVTYAITLDRPSRVRLDAVAQPDAFAVGAYLLDGCGDVGPRACGYGFDEVVPAGEYVLVIDGVDANALGLVVVRVEVEGFPDAPANDTCGGAEALVGAEGQVQGDTRGATDDYQLGPNNACTGYGTVAPDVAYTLPLVGGQRTFVHAEPAAGWDLSLYLVSDCDDLGGDCRGHDGALGESVVFTPESDGEVNVVIDGANGEAGPFELTWGTATCENDAECGEGRCVMFNCAP